MIAVVASLPFFLLNRTDDPERIPPVWTLPLGSLDAGIQEECFMRLFLVTLFAWIGGLLWRDEEGRPDPAVLWVAIIMAGLIFAWAHMDDQVLN